MRRRQGQRSRCSGRGRRGFVERRQRIGEQAHGALPLPGSPQRLALELAAPVQAHQAQVRGRIVRVFEAVHDLQRRAPVVAGEHHVAAGRGLASDDEQRAPTERRADPTPRPANAAAGPSRAATRVRLPAHTVARGAVPMDDRGVPVADVALVVEVVASSTTLQDRMVKPAFYAAAGIPNYWRIEINPFKGRFRAERLPVLFAYALDDSGEYQLAHRVPADQLVTLRSPFAFTVDTASWLR